MDGCFACISVETNCVQFPKRPEGGTGSFGTMCVLGIKVGSSRKAVIAPNH